MFKLDLHVIKCRHTHIFLRSKVWFVPRLNLDEEILFHILILERTVRIGQRRSECRQSKLSVMKHLKVSRRDIFDNQIQQNKKQFKATYRHNWIKFRNDGERERENTIIY